MNCEPNSSFLFLDPINYATFDEVLTTNTTFQNNRQFYQRKRIPLSANWKILYLLNVDNEFPNYLVTILGLIHNEIITCKKGKFCREIQKELKLFLSVWDLKLPFTQKCSRAAFLKPARKYWDIQANASIFCNLHEMIGHCINIDLKTFGFIFPLRCFTYF